MIFRLLAALFVCALPLAAQGESLRPPDPVVLFIILSAISLAPFLAIMLTSFVKVSIVLSMVKSALGTQVPPGQVTSGLAIVLTIFIMAPVGQQMYNAAGMRDTSRGVFALDNLTALYDAAQRGKEPLRKFLLKHASANDRALFVSLSRKLDQNAGLPVESSQPATPNEIRPDQEFRIILPAFVTSELKSSFQVGFLVLLPFLILDLVVANILFAVGLQMVQPALISLPLKILLFVVADGWYLLVKGLVLSYA